MNARAVKVIAITAISLIAIPIGVSAKDQPGAFLVSNSILAASVDRLTAESRTFREAVDAVTPTRRRVVMTTPDQLPHQVNIAFDSAVLAQTYPISDEHARVDVVVVVFNLDLLQKLSGLPARAVDYEDDLDRIVAHEIYGHALPLLLAGNLSGTCADPAAGQAALASCAVQRENVIRMEMKLGRRVDYGREGLALARRYQQ